MKTTSLSGLPRSVKRVLFLAADTVFVPISLYLAFALRFGTLTPLASAAEGSWVLFPIMTVLGVGLIHIFRLPLIKLDAFENRAMLQIGLVAMSLTLASMACSYLFLLAAPRSVPLTFGAVFFLMSVGMRLAGLYALNYALDRAGSRVPVAIYGAGAAGIQMAAALRQSREARPVLFVDDNTTLHGMMVAGRPVYSPDSLPRLIRRHDIERVLIAMPSISKDRQNALVNKLKELPVDVQVLPSYVDMMAGNGPIDALRPVSPDELLGRDKVELDTPEIAKAYAGRVVMVTGAGGSIGSELCRQLLNCQPARIILFEQGEFQLYTIDRELKGLAQSEGIEVTSRLGSVTNKTRVQSVIATEGVEIILHAAAYKHVPLVEDNELEGARNNVIGTQIVAEAAEAAGIERMILVSTDKAVRPTNIMGATKRMAELVVQDIQTRAEVTKFAMVRFGNVLGSSGSVLPLFQAQIAAGGPVTVTHPDVTRFFMTIPEAARLVLLAGAYARGGDVFVLDMGAPRKIIDIAHEMIVLSGGEVKNPATGTGNIAIEITGLRPGEKLYEELLIDAKNLRPTPHAKIMRAEESMLSQLEVAAMLRELQTALSTDDKAKVRHLVKTRVEGYHQQVVDGLPKQDRTLA